MNLFQENAEFVCITLKTDVQINHRKRQDANKLEQSPLCLMGLFAMNMLQTLQVL